MIISKFFQLSVLVYTDAFAYSPISNRFTLISGDFFASSHLIFKRFFFFENEKLAEKERN